MESDHDSYPRQKGKCPNCGFNYGVKFINKFHCLNCEYPIIVFAQVQSAHIPAGVFYI